MPLYLKDKKATLFKGDYKPMSLYLGDKRVAGYEYAELSGESLAVDGTYNDSAWLRINGKTIEVGEGDKSPDNPYELKSVENFDLVSEGNAGQLQSTHFPHALRSLPDGTRDYIEIDNVGKTAKLYRSVGEVVFNGTENWWFNSERSDTIMFNHTPFADVKYDLTRTGGAISTHFKSGTTMWSKDVEGMHLSTAGHNFFIQIKKSTIDIDGSETTGPQKQDKLKAWLTAQNTAGTPLRLLVCRQTPTITDLDYNETKTFYPYTQFYTTGSELSPDLDVTVRVM